MKNWKKLLSLTAACALAVSLLATAVRIPKKGRRGPRLPPEDWTAGRRAGVSG